MSKLHDEIVNDPENMGYDGRQDGDIAFLINQKLFEAPVSVPVANIATLVRTTPGMMTRLKAAMVNSEIPDLVKEAVETIIILCGSQNAWKEVDMKDPATFNAVNTMVGGLIAYSIITSEEGEKLLALGIGSASRAEILGLGYVDHLTVAGARNA